MGSPSVSEADISPVSTTINLGYGVDDPSVNFVDISPEGEMI